ncbi:unnamed protein product [Soboliphyme baturini]|uniref:Uncharacterized protein n=1 Tax=Soboliphyme baturini TaxID=241478 RepID=A0A183J4E1_9BILA|nr:unnamed protein product [Soboliphyme baturini]
MNERFISWYPSIAHFPDLPFRRRTTWRRGERISRCSRGPKYGRSPLGWWAVISSGQMCVEISRSSVGPGYPCWTMDNRGERSHGDGFVGV